MKQTEMKEQNIRRIHPFSRCTLPDDTGLEARGRARLIEDINAAASSDPVRSAMDADFLEGCNSGYARKHGHR